MVVQHRDLVIDAHTPPALARPGASGSARVPPPPDPPSTGTADVDDHGQVVVRPAPHVVLGDDDIAALEHLTRRVQEHWGRPTALGWALAQGHPWILRARPRS